MKWPWTRKHIDAPVQEPPRELTGIEKHELEQEYLWKAQAQRTEAKRVSELQSRLNALMQQYGKEFAEMENIKWELNCRNYSNAGMRQSQPMSYGLLNSLLGGIGGGLGHG